jgi:hypothetical protein
MFWITDVILMQGNCTVFHQMESRKSAGERQEEGQGAKEQDPVLQQLQEQCLNELKHLVLETSRQVGIVSILQGLWERQERVCTL